MYPELAKLLFVLGLVIPGLMCIRLGQRTRRKDGVAIESLSLFDPIFISLLFITSGSMIYGSRMGTNDYDLSWGRGFPGHLIFLGFLIAMRLFLSGFFSSGQIVILRGRKDVVMDAVRRILVHYKLRYELDVDVFDIPSIKMKITVDDELRWGQVSVHVKTKDGDWWTIITEAVIKMFEGTPSSQDHPALTQMGGVFVGIGIALGVAFLIA